MLIKDEISICEIYVVGPYLNARIVNVQELELKSETYKKRIMQ